jgi:hypothetical protein
MDTPPFVLFNVFGEQYLATISAFRASVDAEPLLPTEVRRIRNLLWNM